MKSRRDHNHSLKTSSTNKNNTFEPIKEDNHEKIETDLRSSQSIIDSIKEPIKKLNSKSHHREKWRKSKNGFPIHVLPNLIQELALEANQKHNFPLEFSCSSSLFALSISIGNIYHIKFKEGFSQNASLYMVLISRAGSIKSHPVKLFVKPLIKLDKEAYNNYSKELTKFELESSMSNSDKKNNGIETISKPIFKQTILNDYTIEALLKAHRFNRKGIGLYIDEFLNWINKFERYNNSTQEQDFLTYWNGDDFQVNRVSEEPLRIDKTFISVIGTTQSDLIRKAFKNKISSGLTDRILICEPIDLKKEAWNNLEVDKSIFEEYENFIRTIAKLEVTTEEYEVKPIYLNFKHEAFDASIEWNEEFSGKANNEFLDSIKQVYPKFDLYFLRFCLILQVGKYYAKETNTLDIEMETVKDAIDLVEYYKENAIHFRKSIINSDPIDSLPENKRQIFEGLPKYFETKDAVAKAKHFDLSERSVKQFLSDKIFFKRIKHGHYEKM